MVTGSASAGRDQPTAGAGFRERYRLVGRSRVGIRTGLAVSLAAHVAMFGGALAYARLAPPRVRVEQPIIAKLVRLGTPRNKRLLPRLPSPTRSPSTSRVAPVPTPGAVPNPAAVKERALEEKARRILQAQQRLADALGHIGPAPQGPTGKTVEPPVGEADGDANGNADTAAAGDRYLALVQATLRRNFVLPQTIGEKERMYLQAVVNMQIGADGRIIEARLAKSSGNTQFDDAISSALKRMTLPAPPPGFLAQYPDGFQLNYHP